MSHAQDNAEPRPEPSPTTAPPANKVMIAAATICLVIPLVALLWVSSYARETPRLFGFPFFFWYQFLWVFICSALTWTAHRLVLAARSQDSSGRPSHRREGRR